MKNPCINGDFKKGNSESIDEGFFSSPESDYIHHNSNTGKLNQPQVYFCVEQCYLPCVVPLYYLAWFPTSCIVTLTKFV